MVPAVPREQPGLRAQTRPCREAGEAPRGAREGRARDAPLGPGRRARAKAAGRPGFCGFLDLSRTRGAGPGFWGAERLCDLGPDASPLGLGFLVCNARGLKEGERSGFIQQLRRLRLKRDSVPAERKPDSGLLRAHCASVQFSLPVIFPRRDPGLPTPRHLTGLLPERAPAPRG